MPTCAISSNNMACPVDSSTMALKPGIRSAHCTIPQRGCLHAKTASLAKLRSRRILTTRMAATTPGQSSFLVEKFYQVSDATNSPETVANQIYTVADQMTPETASTISAILGPVFAIGTLLMTLRIITTWYPETDGSKMPWLLVYFPTEWILAPTRKVVPPSFGVDISPVVWVAIISFANEILLGPQGILNLIIREQLAS